MIRFFLCLFIAVLPLHSASAAESRLALLAPVKPTPAKEMSVQEQLTQIEEQIKKIRTTLSQSQPHAASGLINGLQTQKPITLLLDQSWKTILNATQIALSSVQFITQLPQALEWLALRAWSTPSYTDFSIFIAKLALAALICLGIFMLIHTAIDQIARRLGRYQALLWRLVGYTIAYGILPYLATSILLFLNLPSLEQEIGFLCALAIAIALLLVHLSQIILEPHREQRRLLPINSSYALRIHRFIKWFAFVGVGCTYGIFIFVKLGMSFEIAATLGRLISFTIFLNAVLTIIQLRRLYGHTLGTRVPTRGLWVRNAMLKLWHIPLIAVAYAIYLDFCNIVTAQPFIVSMLLSLLLTALIAFVEDKVFYIRTHLLHHMLRAYTKPVDLNSDEHSQSIDQAISWLVYFLGGLAILELWGIHVIAWITSGVMQTILQKALVIAFIILSILLILRLSNFLFTRYSKKTDRRDHSNARVATVIAILRNSLRVGLWVPAIFLILSELGFDITPLVASFSLISLAVGIGAQNLVKDIITGLFIILEDTVSVGDYVTLDSLTGHVEALTIRTIALRAEDGTLHTIPFSSITRVSNLTRQYAVVVSLVAIGYAQPLEPAFAAIRTAYQNLANDPRIAKWLLGKFEIKGVDEFRDNGIIIKSLIQTVVLRHNDVKRAFNLELKKVFDQENIAFAHAEPEQHLVEIRNKTAPAVI